MQPTTERTNSDPFGFQMPSVGVQPFFGVQSNVEAPISSKDCDEEIINKVNKINDIPLLSTYSHILYYSLLDSNWVG